MAWDVFISHASEDKDEIARPLAEQLTALKFAVWFDEAVLTIGDSLRRKIDEGLSKSTFGVVILSPNFFAKEWPQRELDGLVALEDGKSKRILPVWHKVTHDDVKQFSAMLADRLSVSTSKGIDHVIAQIQRAIGAAAPAVRPTPTIPRSVPVSPGQKIYAAAARAAQYGLRPEAIRLLKKACSGTGTIIGVQADAGYFILIDGETFGDGTPRSQQAFKEGLRQLSAARLVEQTDSKVFQVTTRGYDLYDQIKD